MLTRTLRNQPNQLNVTQREPSKEPVLLAQVRLSVIFEYCSMLNLVLSFLCRLDRHLEVVRILKGQLRTRVKIDPKQWRLVSHGKLGKHQQVIFLLLLLNTRIHDSRTIFIRGSILCLSRLQFVFLAINLISFPLPHQCRCKQCKYVQV